MQYPEEKSTDAAHGMGQWSLSPRWRGTHRMLTDEQGRSKCVACGLCPQICPANCIKLVPGRGRAGQPVPADLRDRRVPLRLLRVLPGGLSRGSDPRGRALRERGVQPGSLRLRPGAALRRRPIRSRRSGTRPTPGASRMTETVFYIFAAVAVGSAAMCILQRSPVSALIWLVAGDARARRHLRAAPGPVHRRHPDPGVCRRHHGALPLHHHAAERGPSAGDATFGARGHRRGTGGRRPHRGRAERPLGLHARRGWRQRGPGVRRIAPGGLRVRGRTGGAAGDRRPAGWWAASRRRCSRRTWFPSRSPRSCSSPPSSAPSSSPSGEPDAARSRRSASPPSCSASASPASCSGATPSCCSCAWS